MNGAADHRDARQIAQHLLDLTGAALLSGDAKGFADHFVLPQILTTVRGANIVQTRADLITTFHSMRRYMADNGVNRYERKVELALFDEPDVIRQTYISRLLDGTRLTQPPYTNHSVLRRFKGRWKVESSHYSFADRPEQDKALLGALPDRPNHPVGPDEMNRTNVTDIVQGALDKLTKAYLSGDFDRVRKWVKLPLFMQRSDHTQLIETEQDLREDYDRFLNEYRASGITDIIRTVKSADLLGETRIHGTYRSYVLANQSLARPSYTSALTIDQGADKRWRVSSILHPASHRLGGRTGQHAPWDVEQDAPAEEGRP